MAQDYIFLIYGTYFLLALFFSWLVNGLLLRFAVTLGTRNQDESMVRWNPNVKPSLGGLTFFIIFMMSLGCHSLLFPSSATFINIKWLGQITAIILAFLVGLADDAYDTRPVLKFGGQLLCALVLIFSGNSIMSFEQDWINHLLTIVWVIGLMNSINMLDNMDAITGVVSLGILAGGMIASWFMKEMTDIHFILLTGTAGAIGGFLFYNWHPSRLFMGDTGSQFLGSLLAIIGIRFFWNNPSALSVEEGPLQSIILALLVFILPISDTTSVTINRLLKKKSPFVGGRDHTTHHLSYLGLTDSQVAFLFLFLSFATSLLLWVTLKYGERWGNIVYVIDALFCLLVFASLFVATRIKKEKA